MYVRTYVSIEIFFEKRARVLPLSGARVVPKWCPSGARVVPEWCPSGARFLILTFDPPGQGLMIQPLRLALSINSHLKNGREGPVGYQDTYPSGPLG